MHWPRWKRLRFVMGLLLCGSFIVSMAACSSPPKKERIKPYFCKPLPAYTETGALDTGNIRVDIDCLDGLQKRVDACYAPQ